MDTIPTTSSSFGTPKPRTKAQQKAKEARDDILYGSMAGIVGKVVEFPFDTIKVRLQSQPDHLPLRYTGAIDCFRQSISADGFRGLYRGVSAPLAGAAAENASLFYSYQLGQDLIRAVSGIGQEQELGLKAKVGAGGISGAITACVLTPIELIKCRMQVPLQSSTDLTLGRETGLASKSLSPFTIIGDVYRREGLYGFWRGHMGTFLRETGGTAAWFGAWEATRLAMKQRIATRDGTSVADVELPLSQQMLAGAVGGMSYNLVLYPADTIKSKIQTGELSSGSGPRPSFLGVGKEIWRAHGMKGLYRGCGITVARSAPSSALIFTIFENLKKTFA